VAPTIERIGSGCACNLMRVLIRLTAPQRSFLTHDPTFIPCIVFWGDCGKLDSWHNMPSYPPSIP